jgi:S1-C subfamily serine protease
LQEFVNSYSKSVVTISCSDGTGSGVSIPFGVSAWISELGAKSLIATNMHVVEDCIFSGSNWRANQVTILHQGVEYVGYVNAWPSYSDYLSGAKPDLAAVMTTGSVPQTSYWNVRAPQLGDAVVAIGSAGGVPNVATRGEIAGVTTKDIITTAPAGHGSSGGALFNNDGQLLGFIYSANASLVNVVPIPRLCEAVFACTTPITYAP